MSRWSMAALNTIAKRIGGWRRCAIPAFNARLNVTWGSILSGGPERPRSPQTYRNLPPAQDIQNEHEYSKFCRRSKKCRPQSFTSSGARFAIADGRGGIAQ